MDKNVRVFSGAETYVPYCSEDDLRIFSEREREREDRSDAQHRIVVRRFASGESSNGFIPSAKRMARYGSMVIKGQVG